MNRLFHFVRVHLAFLRNIPLLPLVFDNLLKLFCFFASPSVLNQMDDIDEALSGWPGITASFHKYGGIQYNLGKRELGHIHGNGITDIQLSKSTAEQLIQKGMAAEHHTIKNAGWVSIYLNHGSNTESAIIVFGLAYEQMLKKNPATGFTIPDAGAIDSLNKAITAK